MKNFIAKMGAVLLASAAVLVLSGCGEDSGTSDDAENETSPNVNMGSMVDSRDGQAYKTVQIGGQTWMAENLNYQTGESKCYENKPENCEKYGRLYTWAAAMDSAAIFSKDGARCGDGKECDAIGTVRGVCPEGWHLPSEEDLEELKKLAGQKAGDIDMAGTMLKSTTGWMYDAGKGGNGTDGLGFGALPVGYYDSSFDDFYYEGSGAYFWSSTEGSSSDAYTLNLDFNRENAYVGLNDKNLGFSVRCVKNP